MKITTIEQLRNKLGMKPDQLITNLRGEVADMLCIDGADVVLGIVGTGQQIKVPIENFVRDEQAAKEFEANEK